MREDLIYLIAAMPDSVYREVLVQIVKPTASEVEHYFDNEGGNTERSFEMFGVQPDDLKYPRGE